MLLPRSSLAAALLLLMLLLALSVPEASALHLQSSLGEAALSWFLLVAFFVSPLHFICRSSVRAHAGSGLALFPVLCYPSVGFFLCCIASLPLTVSAEDHSWELAMLARFGFTAGGHFSLRVNVSV
jgi:hypothetical protein